MGPARLTQDKRWTGMAWCSGRGRGHVTGLGRPTYVRYTSHVTTRITLHLLGISHKMGTRDLLNVLKLPFRCMESDWSLKLGHTTGHTCK
ncbi:hypothetical protein ElyMa_005693500 [Elysia marginata]|uniref:Uncharacterized protein n=1 Tax=Elysia marginata TaxID=1093978 RepID=A0AAV4FF97_9GAST|nr:hypothetical protein ElyMa_005693500 [Elysia marginata]